MKPKRLKKFNNGNGAILCNGCRVILMEGFASATPYGTITKEEWESEEPIYCKKCEKKNDTTRDEHSGPTR